MTMVLRQLIPQSQSDLPIQALTLDSRHAHPGTLFFAVPGHAQDGRAYIADALARGASAVVYEADGAAEIVQEQEEAVLLPVTGLSAQLSAIASRFYGDPAQALHLVGITGTNGKTSVSQLLAQALEALGESCAVIGTMGAGFPGKLKAGHYTTPDALSVQRLLAELKQAGARTVSMEVSSHALDQDRVAAVAFDTAVFTNLSRDHLDYHGNMQAYGEAKAKLMRWPGLENRVINMDDAWGRQLAAEKHPSRLWGYSLQDMSADLHCVSATFSDTGISAEIVTPGGRGVLRTALLGRFNLSNLLAVVAVLLGRGYSLPAILEVTPYLRGPAGRMQCAGGNGQPLVVIDYAHTPDALEQVLQALRPHVSGRLMCLFGCGGERDKGKRPLMAEVAERLADVVWVTDDNPRHESPESIIADIRSGFRLPEQVVCQPGRARAIRSLMATAQADDVIVLAGKGHEDYQDIQGVRHPFSDLRETAMALFVWRASHV